MKYLVVSDVHGSLFYAAKIRDLFKLEKADKIILLGDLYYHGPRNKLPLQYNPMEVSNIFNDLANHIYCIKGNCDAEVDEMISKFKFHDNLLITLSDKKFMFTHGHHINIDNKPKDIDVLVYGHFHTGFIKKEEEVYYINSGSISLPKNNTLNSYLIIDEKSVYLKDLSGNIIDKCDYI